MGSTTDTLTGAAADIVDASDERIAVLDLGRGKLLALDGTTTIAEISSDGEVLVNSGERRSSIEGYRWAYMHVAAMYLTLVDPGILSDTER